MNIQTLASGSKGNAHIINNDLLLDCGLPISTLDKKSENSLYMLQACLCTHEHKDHSKAIKALELRGVPVYASAGTYEALDLFAEASNMVSNYHFAEAGKTFEVGNYRVLPFEVFHSYDTPDKKWICQEPLGFLIQEMIPNSISGSCDKLVYITDTRYSKTTFQEITHYMVECNYSEELINQSLQSGKIPQFLYDRIRHTHFSLEQVREFFTKTDLSKCREIHLIHISKNNGDPEGFKAEIEGLTGIPVYV
jgi:phosphoribosyl 1,2-cyclic phosphodiesterase